MISGITETTVVYPGRHARVYLASKPRYEILDGLRRLAYAALKLYDLPIHEWLKDKLFGKTE